MTVMRLEKFLAATGFLSRRAAKKHIQSGRVTVNGEAVFIPGTPIDPQRDRIELDRQPVQGEPEKLYLMVNKPAGYLTTVRDDRGRPTVMALVRDIPQRIFPVGRLDYDTEGLLIFTNDGEFAYHLTHPSHEMPKTYTAWVQGQPSQQAIERLRRGIEIESGRTYPAVVAQIGKKPEQTQFKIVIHEGKKRQVRRMFHAVGHPVVFLKRVQIGSLSLGNLPRGQYRRLAQEEIDGLKEWAPKRREE